MLVRVRGATEKINEWTYKLSLNLPVVYLDNVDYNIALRMIFFENDHSLGGYPVSQLWSLQTTAVDMSAINPKQEISSFPFIFNPGSDYSFVYYEPAIARQYKIQLPAFHTSEFILSSLTPDEFLEISYVEILLEISKNVGI